jgi:ribosomal protein S18 acetylase RimI-like enzyme
VRRALHSDIPQLVTFQGASLWVYADPNAGPSLVAFGTLQLATTYAKEGHCYIPLLSARPGAKGYGDALVQHLIAEAAILVRTHSDISKDLFLDVYVANAVAIGLYERNGFIITNKESPLLDDRENNEPYYVMVRSVSQ